ncbi:MAG TPA: polysaccharide deacetylase family protein [Ignavibacteriaceae bacterium]|nr:polysaccharide deacetylase family protein [Ignavibacteriaceae bacterium]
MLHSIGNTYTDWIYKFLSIKLNQVENLFLHLANKKIKTFFIRELYNNDFKLADNEIALSFDDGYLDNWVYLFPLLEKYNIKATIFVNPEFVDPRNLVREKSLAEFPLKNSDNALGFLSWEEMKIMEKSGLVDIQSHTMSHTWYSTSPKLIDFYLPTQNFKPKNIYQKYPWISWNEKPEQKPYTHNTFAYYSKKYGFPIFENGRSLGIRKFIPEDNLIEIMINWVTDNPEIITQRDHNSLFEKFNEFKSHDIGRFETDNELKERYWYELTESKKIIEKKLNKEVNILCWPGGAYNEVSLKMSEEAGYIASTISSKEKNPIENKNKTYKRIPRKPMTGNVSYKNKYYGPSFFNNVLVHKNYPQVLSNTLIKTEKLVRLVLNK